MGKINIKYGESCGDCTCVYNISIPPEMTVREFIDEWLTNKKEWGFLGIFTPDSVFGSPMCAYSQGEINGKPLPDEVLDKKIVKATGTGGWSRSDFKFVV